MTSKEISCFFQRLFEVKDSFSLKSTSASNHKILKELYQVIQKCPKRVAHFNSLTSKEQEVFLSLVQSLVSILSCHVFTADSLLLSGTCLAVLIAELFHPKFASIFLISLYTYIGQKTQDHQKYKHEDKKNSYEGFPELLNLQEMATKCAEESESLYATVAEFTQEKFESAKRKVPTFHQIAVLHGILSSQKSELLPFQSNFFNHQPFLISMFNSIYMSCLTPCATQYHAFNVLVNWLKICERILPKLLSNEYLKVSYFSYNAEIVTQLLCLLESNWESPIKGVSSFVKEAYRLIITISRKESDFWNAKDVDVAEYIVEQTLQLSWKVKGKYLVLSVILQFVDYRKFLKQNPDIPNEVIFNLKANYASSVISEVYKSIVSAMKQSNSSLDEMKSEWCKWWRSPIIKSLCSEDKLLIQNITNLIIPWTLKSFPTSYELLLDGFEKEANVAPKLMLLHIAKESGICVLQNREVVLIRKYIHHHDCQLRMEILSVLCCSPKKSEPLSIGELELLKEFVVVNLNIDSTPFQQLCLSQFRILLIRIRDSLVQEYRAKCKDENFQLNYPQLEFVDWLAVTAVSNTFPGACFQRRRLSLLILDIIFDVFVTSPLGNKRKEKPSKCVQQLIQWAIKEGKWIFFEDDLLLNILPCITDFTDEIRLTAFNLLVKFSHWPNVGVPKSIFSIDSLLQYSYSLCNHPDYRSNDGGAYLLCFIYKKLYVSDVAVNDLQISEYITPLDFLNGILMRAKDQLTIAEENFLNAALQFPIHGLLLALQYCLNCSKDVLENLFTTGKEEILQFFQTVADLCDDVIQYMLNVMKGKDEKENCPSFSDIGVALEKLIAPEQEQPQESSDRDSSLEEGQKVDVKESLNLPQLDLLLSCCWHSIKNSCFLLCELSSCIFDLEMEKEFKKQFLQHVASTLSSILITCRHRGVVDACSLALNKFCKMLQKDEVLHDFICKFLLNQVFNSLSDALTTSVTRRSAGLPSLCQAIVSSEENNIKRQLLSFTIGKLLDCIDQPLPSQQISDKTDLPQAHAYHILKALVMDSTLSQAILSHLDGIIPACVSGFSSPLWPIRNGALQLFGVLLPRICGQKKVRDDDSEHNLVSASELFSRCPILKTYLLQQLEKCVQFHHKKELCSELVPVLSIIVKLSPSHNDKENLMEVFRALLLELLDIPVWKVRDLVTSALSVLVTENDVLEQIKKMKNELETNSIKVNKIHGILLVLQKVLKKDINFFSDQHCLWISLQDLHKSLATIECSLLLGLLLDIMLLVLGTSENSIPTEIWGEILVTQAENAVNVGQMLHKSKITLLKLKAAEIGNVSVLLKYQKIKDTSIITECLQFLVSKLHSEINKIYFYDESNLKIWKDICISVIEYIGETQHPSVIQEALRFIVDLCSDWKVGLYVLDSVISQLIEEHLLHHLDMKSGLSAAALSLTVLSLCLKSSLYRWDASVSLEKWNMIFNSFSQPRSPDILRMQAAVSVAIFGHNLAEFLSKKIKNGCEKSSLLFIGLCEGSLLLLQDEDEEIRNEACQFPSNIPHKYEINYLQFNIGIQVVLEYMHEVMSDDNNFLLYLWNRLQNYPSADKVLRSTEKSTKMYLFEQEYVNVFAEPMMLLLIYEKLFKKTVKEIYNRNRSNWLERVEMFLYDVKVELHDVYIAITSGDQTILAQGFAYPHQVFLALKKLHCQVKVLKTQKPLLPTDSPLHKSLEEALGVWKSIMMHLSLITCWFFNHL